MPLPSPCPKCAGPMAEGFLLELMDHGSHVPTRWVEGAPEPSFWTGVKVKDRAMLPITTYRCGRCGFLESYANPE